MDNPSWIRHPMALSIQTRQFVQREFRACSPLICDDGVGYFPAAAQRLVKQNVLHCDTLLRDGLLVLQIVELSLCVQDIQEIG